MRVFVTGATGFVGSAVVKELLAAGHAVVGLARSAEGAAALETAGAVVRRGSVEDLDGLRAAAAEAEGVIHLAFNHDFSRYLQNCADDRRVVRALGEALAGSGRPLLVTSGLSAITPGRLSTEDDPPASSSLMPRAASDQAAAEAASMGAAVSVMRLPQVHDTRHFGLISPVIDIARARGEFAYIGDGSSRWAAAHVSDVARLYRLALEAGAPNAVYHAVAEEGVTMRAITEAAAARLGLPVRSITEAEAGEVFGWMAGFAARDVTASSAKTQASLGWTPAGPTLLEDLARSEVDA